MTICAHATFRDVGTRINVALVEKYSYWNDDNSIGDNSIIVTIGKTTCPDNIMKIAATFGDSRENIVVRVILFNSERLAGVHIITS